MTTNNVEQHWNALHALVEGLAKTDFLARGEPFAYMGARVYPEDLADMLTSSLLCLGQEDALYTGVGDFGYVYDPDGEQEFPMDARPGPGAQLAPFHRIAPFITHAFDEHVLRHRAEIELVFESALRRIYPDITLDRSRSDPAAAQPSGAGQAPGVSSS